MRRTIDYYAGGIRSGDRIVLAQAITLVESTLTTDQELAGQLVEKLTPAAGNAVRIGITGSPGVGKSTFIESFGQYVTGLGKRIAVLTIDPSSQLTGGSILGDKTRMEELARNPSAFIRPSPSADALGGVAHRTRETIILCEAAGFDTIIVETVGVGQSEVAVKNMTDFFLLLMLAGSGDELQGIKKGIMEMADAVIITKADGDNQQRAREAQADFRHALHLLYHGTETPPDVLLCSATERTGLAETWRAIENTINRRKLSGAFEALRRRQRISHLTDEFQALMRRTFEGSQTLQGMRKKLEEEVAAQQLSPASAARQLFDAFRKAGQGSSS